jgi:hypothetical protein
VLYRVPAWHHSDLQPGALGVEEPGEQQQQRQRSSSEAGAYGVADVHERGILELVQLSKHLMRLHAHLKPSTMCMGSKALQAVSSAAHLNIC